MATKTEELLKEIENLKLVELNDLVEALKDKYGITGAVAMASPASAGGEGENENEKSEFDVFIKEVGSNKIGVIKVVKAITGLGLKDAKEIVEKGDKAIKEGLNKKEADDLKAQLEETGATVELK